MVRRFAWLLALLTAPSLVHAQGSEKYLPANSQLFWQWDGYVKHQGAIAKTAFGLTLEGDTGAFLKAAWSYSRQGLDLAKQHTDPNLIDAVQDAIDAMADIYRHGLTVGITIKNVQPPEVFGVVVLNKAGGEKGKILSLIHRAKVFAGDLVQEEKIGRRSVFTMDTAFVKVGWWSEADDLVITVGSDGGIDHARAIDAGKTGIEKQALFQAVKKAPEFVSWTRGYLDAAALVKMGGDVSPEISTLIDDLGLKGVKNVIGYSGFDGLVCRSVMEIDLPGPRKGLGNLIASGRKIKLEELPPLPSDVASFSAMSFSPTKAYNSLLDSVGAFTKMYLGQENFARDMIQQIEVIGGIRFSDDLIGSLDDLFVSYNAPSDGILGGVMAMKVKNEQKLRSAIESVAKALPQIPGAGETTVKKRKYQGVEITELHMRQEGNYKVPSFAIHKGWIVYADYPQAVKGFILRLEGKLPLWKMSDDIRKALEPFPKEFSSIAISDPRPQIEMILSALPPIIAGANGFVDRVEGLKPFDTGLVPHAGEATRLLFPSVSMTTDDGRKIRTETRSALP